MKDLTNNNTGISLPCEDDRSLGVCTFWHQRPLDVAAGIEGDARYSRGCHEGHEVDEEVAVLADDVEGLAAQVHKVLEALARLVPSIDHIGHVGRQNKRHAISGISETNIVQPSKLTGHDICDLRNKYCSCRPSKQTARDLWKFRNKHCSSHYF